MDEIERMARILHDCAFPSTYSFDRLPSAQRSEYFRRAKEIDDFGYTITPKETKSNG